VYGNVVNIGEKGNGNAQHLGLGTKMIKIAEDISRKNGFKKISVISAVGTRQYYRKLQFIDGVLYMSKEI
jgi:elongator complex protein 3